MFKIADESTFKLMFEFEKTKLFSAFAEMFCFVSGKKYSFLLSLFHWLGIISPQSLFTPDSFHQRCDQQIIFEACYLIYVIITRQYKILQTFLTSLQLFLITPLLFLFFVFYYFSPHIFIYVRKFIHSGGSVFFCFSLLFLFSDKLSRQCGEEKTQAVGPGSNLCRVI